MMSNNVISKEVPCCLCLSYTLSLYLQFFPYILLLVAVLLYIPALFWRFTATPSLSSDLSFIMEELDRCYNRAIRLAKSLTIKQDKDIAEDPHRCSAVNIFKTPAITFPVVTNTVFDSPRVGIFSAAIIQFNSHLFV